jgi:hypothetical protein
MDPNMPMKKRDEPPMDPNMPMKKRDDVPGDHMKMPDGTHMPMKKRDGSMNAFPTPALVARHGPDELAAGEKPMEPEPSVYRGVANAHPTAMPLNMLGSKPEKRHDACPLVGSVRKHDGKFNLLSLILLTFTGPEGTC